MNTRPADVMPCDRCPRLRADLDEMRRRRDEWRKKAEGYDAVRLALREKVGAPWPPNLSRSLWAGIAADEKKRADDAEAALAGLADALVREADIYTGMEALAKEAGDTMSTLNFQGAAFALRDVASRIRAGEFPKEGE